MTLRNVLSLVVACAASSALAEPAVIYDMGGKFDKSFNEAAFAQQLEQCLQAKVAVEVFVQQDLGKGSQRLDGCGHGTIVGPADGECESSGPTACATT